jgi:hypothetical protein
MPTRYFLEDLNKAKPSVVKSVCHGNNIRAYSKTLAIVHGGMEM